VDKKQGADKNGPKNYNDADVELTFTVDEKFLVKTKATAKGDANFNCEYDCAEGMKVKLGVNNPSYGATDNKTECTLAVEYLDAAFSVEAEGTLFKGMKDGAPVTKGESGFQAGFATDCPGLEGVTVGACPAIGLKADGSQNIALPFSLGSGDKSQAFSFSSTMLLVDGAPKLATAGIKGYYKINDPLAIGVEVEHSQFKMGKKFWQSHKKEDPKVEFKIGAEYKPSKTTTFKAKATFEGKTDSKPTLDLSSKFALEGKSNVVVAACLAGGAPKVGFTYNLEA